MENIIKVWEEYLKRPLVGYEKGFIQSQGAQPHQWELCERQQGQGWVYPLTFPETLSDYLDMVMPDADLKGFVKALSISLVEAKTRIALRNRQIRDLRRQLRK